LKKQPVDQNNGKGLPEEIVPSTWGRLILALKVYRPATWLLLLTGSLVLFLAWMPPEMRIIILHGGVAQESCLVCCLFLAYCHFVTLLRLYATILLIIKRRIKSFAWSQEIILLLTH
jgi:hypothetical protein